MGKPMSAEAYAGMDQETLAGYSAMHQQKVAGISMIPDRFMPKGAFVAIRPSAADKFRASINDALEPMVKGVIYIIESKASTQDCLDKLAGFVPLSGTEPKPLALSRDTRHYGPEIPVTAFKR